MPKCLLSPERFKLALISKGLRPYNSVDFAENAEFQACPDFKGIKTPQEFRLRFVSCFKLALISKGLRPKC